MPETNPNQPKRSLEAATTRFEGLMRTHRATFPIAESSELDLLGVLEAAPADCVLEIEFSERKLDEDRARDLKELHIRTGVLYLLLKNPYETVDPTSYDQLEAQRSFSFRLDQISKFEICNVLGGRALRLISDQAGFSTDAPFYGTVLRLR